MVFSFQSAEAPETEVPAESMERTGNRKYFFHPFFEKAKKRMSYHTGKEGWNFLVTRIFLFPRSSRPGKERKGIYGAMTEKKVVVASMEVVTSCCFDWLKLT